jgi:arsenate reductase
MKDVLVLCTGNSCRSILAEAIINHLGNDRYRAVSAGSFPTGQVHPMSLHTLQQHGVRVDRPRSKSWDEFADRPFDLVITVCDEAASETCPAFMRKCERLHWSTPDPAKVMGSKEDVERAFEETFQRLKLRVEAELL